MPCLTDRHPGRNNSHASAPMLQATPKKRRQHRVTILLGCYGSMSQLGWSLARSPHAISLLPQQRNRLARQRPRSSKQFCLFSLATMSGQASQLFLALGSPLRWASSGGEGQTSGWAYTTKLDLARLGAVNPSHPIPAEMAHRRPRLDASIVPLVSLSRCRR